MSRSTQIRFHRMPDVEEHLDHHRLDCMSSQRNLENYELARKLLTETPEEEVKPAPLVTGHDLIAAGYKHGPLFKEILRAVEDAQLEGKLRTRDEALGMVAKQFPPGTSS